MLQKTLCRCGDVNVILCWNTFLKENHSRIVGLIIHAAMMNRLKATGRQLTTYQGVAYAINNLFTQSIHSLLQAKKKKETSHTQTNQLKIQQKDKTKLIQTNKQTDHWRNQNYGIRKITFDTQLKIRVSTGSKSLLSFSSAVYTQRVLPRFARPKLQWHFDTQSAFDF